MSEQVRPGQSMSGIFSQQALEEILEIGRHGFRPLDSVLDNQADQLEQAVGVERRLTGKQLVEDAAESPGGGFEEMG